MSWETFNTAIGIGFSEGVWETHVLGLIESGQFEELQSFMTMKEIDKLDSAADRFLDLLFELRQRSATDPRDKIFACLGLVNDTSNELDIVPDYQSPTEHVYINAARAIVTCSGNLDLLGVCSVNQRKGSVLELPSWVPDWSIKGSIALPLGKDAKGPRRKFAAAKDSRASPRFMDYGKTVIVSGYVFNEITELGDSLPDMAELNWEVPDLEEDEPCDNPAEKDGFAYLREAGKNFRHVGQMISNMSSNFFALVPYLSTFINWEKLGAIQDPTPSRTGLSHEEVYWRTLCTNQMPEGYAETQRQYREWYKSLDPIRSLLRWRVGSAPSIFKPIGFAAYLRSTWQKYPDFGHLMKHLTHRRLGRTKGGSLCLVPASAQIGDEIALFRGGSVPLVIRNQGGGYHTLVGEAFVLEIMYGDGFEDSACRDIKIR